MTLNHRSHILKVIKVIFYSSGHLTVDSGQLQSQEIKRFLLWDLGSIHEVIYVLTAVAIAIQDSLWTLADSGCCWEQRLTRI